MMMGMIGPNTAAAGGVSFSLVYQAKADSSNTVLTTQTYGPLTYAAGTRTIVVVMTYLAGTINAVRVGGVSLSHVSSALAVQGGMVADVWESTSTLAGGSQSVAVDYSAAPAYTSAVGIYTLTTTTTTASDAKTGGSPSGITSMAVSPALTVPAGGGALVACFTNAGAALTPSSFTVDDTDTLGGVNMTFGHTTATGSVTPGVSWTGSDGGTIVAVAWAP